MPKEIRHLNLKEVAACYGGNPKIVQRTLQRVHDHLPYEWQQLLATIEEGDSHQVAVVSHRIAGTVLMAGAEVFAANLKEMSHYARMGKLPSAQMIATSLGLYEDVMLEMQQVLNKFAARQAK